MSHFQFLRLFTSKFIHENNKFRFKSDKHTYANSLHRGLKIIRKQLVDFTSTFAEVLIWEYKNCFYPGSSKASFHSEAVVHIYVKSIRYNAKIKQCHRRTHVFVNVFDHWCSFFILNPFRLFACKSTFISLEAACKTIPEKPDALAGQTSPHREKFIAFSQANCL